MSLELMQHVRELFAHHRKFTPFQKVLLCTVLMGVLLSGIRTWWILKVVLTYSLTVYAAVSVTKYIVQCQYYFPSHILLEIYEAVLELVGTVREQLPLEKTQTADNRDSGEDGTNDGEEQFYDSLEDFKDESQSDTSCYQQKLLNISHKDLSVEVTTVIKLIHRDFIGSWYKLFTSERLVLEEGEILLYHIIHSLQVRTSGVKCEKLLEFVLLMFKDHIHNIRQAQVMFRAQSRSKRRRSSAKKVSSTESSQPVNLRVGYSSIEDCYNSKVELHPAVKSRDVENAYQRSIIQLLLIHFLNEEMLGSKSLLCALKEILMCNVLQKVIDLLSDTTFLHEKIIKITSDEKICTETTTSITVLETNISQDNLQPILTSRKASVVKKESHPPSDNHDNAECQSTSQEQVEESNMSKESCDIKWKEDTQLYNVPKGMCNECNRLCSSDKDRISPRPHTCSLGTTPVFFDVTVDPDRVSLSSFNSVCSTSSKEDFKTPHKEGTFSPDAASIHEEEDNTPEVPVSFDIPVSTADGDSVTEKEGVGSKPLDSVESLISTNIFPNIKFPQFVNPLNFSMLRKRSSFTDKKGLSPTTDGEISPSGLQRSLSPGNTSPKSVEMNWPETRPLLFQDIRLTVTETAKEFGSFGETEYTLYTVEYEALYPAEEGESVYRTGSVRRRFREFVNLQSRFEDSSEYKRSMKDVKGPKKILPSLPFGNMGKDTVENRKELLENFLKAVIRKPDLCNSDELKQFLGYSGDGHIAFVRKVPENTGPRIDQRLVKTMSGVFDMIVEGLPTLPQHIPRIISPFDQPEEKDVFTYNTEDTDNIDLDITQDTDKNEIGRVESCLEKFTEEKALELAPCSADDTTLGVSVLSLEEGKLGSLITDTQLGSEKKQLHVLDQLSKSSCPLSDVVLDVLIEVLHSQDHWVCRDNVIQATKVLFGKGLNRFLEEKVDWLTSADMVTFYLRTFRETLWPDGQLTSEPSTEYTDLQKEQIKIQATRCLGEFLPGLLKRVLGKDEFDLAVSEMIDALSYEKLNRHFWYTVFDVLLEELIPEVNTQELQRKLSTTVQAS